LPRGEFDVWQPWKIETQQLGGYDFREKHRPTTLFREVACVNTSGFLLAVVAFLASRPRRSNITAGNRADFKRGELTLKNTTEKGKTNLKKHGHSSTSNIGWHLCGLRGGFHCLEIDPDQFWVGVTCAELKRRNTKIKNAKSHNRGCSASEPLLNERNTTPLVEIVRVHMERMGKFDSLCASTDLAFVGRRGGRSVAGKSGKTMSERTSNS
jgi:hypothetical protein